MQSVFRYDYKSLLCVHYVCWVSKFPPPPHPQNKFVSLVKTEPFISSLWSDFFYSTKLVYFCFGISFYIGMSFTITLHNLWNSHMVANSLWIFFSFFLFKKKSLLYIVLLFLVLLSTWEEMFTFPNISQLCCVCTYSLHEEHIICSILYCWICFWCMA